MIRSHFRFILDYVRANFLIALEYRATFIGQVFGMLLNDIMWIAFWVIYFTRFPVLESTEGGWRIEDVLAMWAVVGVAFGLSMGFFGNALRMAQMISQGDLDYYLSLPKNVLLHVLVSRMDLTALGDILFGTGLFVFFLKPSPDRVLTFLLVSVCGGVVFLAAAILWQSLAFWLGNAEGLATQMWNALILLSTYPAPLFRGAVKLVIFTAVPAAFMSHIPVQLLRVFDPAWLAAELAFAGGALALAVFVFYRGLRRYESGNLMLARS
jgi:ABC-2 type transport system permease protein